MSVRTAADELIDAVRLGIEGAYRGLRKIDDRDEDLWGSGDYTEDFYRRVQHAMDALRTARDLLRER